MKQLHNFDPLWGFIWEKRNRDFVVVHFLCHCWKYRSLASWKLLPELHYVSCLCQIQVQNPHSIKYSGTMQGLKYIWRTEGFTGLFKGNGTNCARIVPNSAVKFFSYERASRFPFLLFIKFHITRQKQHMRYKFVSICVHYKILLIVTWTPSSIFCYFTWVAM